MSGRSEDLDVGGGKCWRKDNDELCPLLLCNNIVENLFHKVCIDIIKIYKGIF